MVITPTIIMGSGIDFSDYNIYQIDSSLITITPPSGEEYTPDSAIIYYCTSQMGDAASWHFTIIGPVDLLDDSGNLYSRETVDWVQDNYPNNGDIEITTANGYVIDVSGVNSIVENDFGGDWGSVLTGWTTPMSQSPDPEPEP